MGLNNQATWLVVGKARFIMLESIMLMHHSRIARLDVLARVIFSLPAVFKREALLLRKKNSDNEGEALLERRVLSCVRLHS